MIAGAAGNFLAPAATMSANAFAAVVGIDLQGTFNTCRASFAHLRKPGARLLAISAPQATQTMPMDSRWSRQTVSQADGPKTMGRL